MSAAEIILIGFLVYFGAGVAVWLWVLRDEPEERARALRSLAPGRGSGRFETLMIIVWPVSALLYRAGKEDRKQERQGFERFVREDASAEKPESDHEDA